MMRGSGGEKLSLFASCIYGYVLSSFYSLFHSPFRKLAPCLLCEQLAACGAMSQSN